MSTGDEELRTRLEAVEETLRSLVAAQDRGEAATDGSGADQADAEGVFWALEGLMRRRPDGAVLLTGALEVPDAGPVRWQYGEGTSDLIEQDWTEAAPVLDALGHPIRLTLLQLVLTGTRTTAELAAQESLGTTGQLHHHLRILVAAGWLTSAGRGRYQIPAGRVVPLLVTLLAARRG